MDDLDCVKYYINGQIKQRGQAAPYVLRSEEYFKQVQDWCQEHIGQYGYGWYMRTYDDEYYQGNVSSMPEFIVITDAEAVTLLKLAFPDVSLLNSGGYNLPTYGRF